MIDLAVDPSAAEPLHRQVYDALRAAILTGALRSGERLPPTRSLAEGLSVARATVAEAYDQLQAEGYIVGRRGSGTFVADDLPSVADRPAVTAQRHAPRLSAWGERVAHGARTANISEAVEPRYDLRPHRVASDLFPWGDWDSAVDRALRDRSALLAPAPPNGYPGLQAAIAAHVAAYRSVVCRPEEIVVVNGTQAGMNLLVQLLLRPGDRVAVEDPGYPSARVALEAQGLDVVRVPVDADGLSIEALDRAGPFRLIHVTPTHQEPTGATLSLARRLALLEIADRTDAIVLEDDYDSEFRYEGRPIESLRGLDSTGRVVYAGTFSKSVLPGLRLGFLVLPPNYVEPFTAARRLWDSGTGMLEQLALAAFMESGAFERHIRRARRVYRARRDALEAALLAAFGSIVEVGERHGGLNLLVRFDLPLDEREIQRRAAVAGVALRSAAEYYGVPPARPTFLMGFAAMPEDDITEAVSALTTGLTSASLIALTR
jgi:GntR family transcriptional regulator / MocR family aminotransferase